MAEGTRPTREAAMHAIEQFLDDAKPGYPTFDLGEDGTDGWAFWIDPEDTTSYVHHDLRIEWYGSRWPESVTYDEMTGAFVATAPGVPLYEQAELDAARERGLKMARELRTELPPTVVGVPLDSQQTFCRKDADGSAAAIRAGGEKTE